jgi:hypothetical protein
MSTVVAPGQIWLFPVKYGWFEYFRDGSDISLFWVVALPRKYGFCELQVPKEVFDPRSESRPLFFWPRGFFAVNKNALPEYEEKNETTRNSFQLWILENLLNSEFLNLENIVMNYDLFHFFSLYFGTLEQAGIEVYCYKLSHRLF